MEKERIDVPTWCRKFRAHIIRPGTSLADRQRIAGREQARQQGVQSQTLSDTVTWLLKEADMHKARCEAAGEPVKYNKKELLKATYAKTGKIFSSDGTPVCCMHLTTNLLTSVITGELVQSYEWAC